MKQSVAVPLTILLGIASSACSEKAHCVDENSQVVDEANCANSVAPELDDAGKPAHGWGHSGFFWYYGGNRSGSRVSGGGYTPSEGVSYSSPAGRSVSSPGVGRGGFGSSVGAAGEGAGS